MTGCPDPPAISHHDPEIGQHHPTHTRVKEAIMPYVNIKITNEGATAEQKATLIEGVTRLLQETLNKNPATTVVVIEEVPTDNWGIGGRTVTTLRQEKG